MERVLNPSINRRKLATLGLVASAYMLNYLVERRKSTPIWEYQSEPPHTFDWDRYVRVAGDPLMKVVADGIVSHHWDWMQIPDREDYSQRWLPPVSDRWYARYDTDNLTILHHVLAHTILGVQDTYLLGLNAEQLAEPGVEGFHYGFQAKGQDDITRSRILVPRNEQTRLLKGTRPLRVLALDSANNELPSIVEGPISRRDPRYRKVRLF